MRLDLAGHEVPTWGYGTVPGPEIRLRVGDRLRVQLENGLPEDTTVHWHGLAPPNGMDGVPGITQDPVAPGSRFTYDFPTPIAGSFMYHAHVGIQLDRGLYGPLIVEPRDEPLSYDREYTLMLDDWRDGVDDHAGHGTPVGAEPTPTRPTSSPSAAGPIPCCWSTGGRPTTRRCSRRGAGDRLRLRVMNIAADTGFRFAVAGHRLTVTHSDGMPVEPVTVDALRLGMGERYDVLVDAVQGGGAWQVGVQPEGRAGLGAGGAALHGQRCLRHAGGGRAPRRTGPAAAAVRRLLARRAAAPARRHPGPPVRPDALRYPDRRPELPGRRPAGGRRGRVGAVHDAEHQQQVAPDAPARAPLPGAGPGRTRPGEGHGRRPRARAAR